MALVQWSAAYLVREWHQMPPHLVVVERQAVKYLSNATSTVILRVAREHFRLVWAALTFMDRVPVKNGKPCIFRVVRVSGTIRKVEEEAIRRAKALFLAAKDEMAGKKSTALDTLFGHPADPVADVTADADDEAGAAGDCSDDDG